ncbi:MAG: bifunctional riboflavin kinase/FAD synthetase [Ignavibacteria bacterium]|nr:bifunctional riboflavin kinase/FAD synthetase [Ignavibacteria bacterium]
MRIIRELSEIDFDRKTAVTVGTFDGVHKGHRKIIEKLISVKEAKGLRSIIVTFEPHPQIVLRNRAHDIKILSTLDEKLEIFESLGADIAYVINFTKEFSETTATEFYRKYLIDGTGLSDLILGYDHMFGKNREGNFDTLKELSLSCGFTVDKVDEFKYDGQHISSTIIRDLLQNHGNVKTVSKILGREYSLTGTVTEGKKLGKELGYPTANISTDNPYKLIPKIGIYAVKAEVNGNTYSGMMSIGRNPTVTDEDSVKLEVNIFDFSEDIYGKTIKVRFLDYIRDEEKFGSLEILKNQLSEDKKTTLKIINKAN